MKLIIEIDEETYKSVTTNDAYVLDDILIENAIANGTPLTESDDCVSREAVLQYIKRSIHDLDYDSEMAYKDVENMPSVQPKRDKGDKE